jgi:hypothetical protein
MTGARDSDFAAIEALARRYFDALYDGDVETFAALFHPAARLFSAGGGTTTILDVPAYLALVKGRVNPRARGDRREDTILSIARPTPSTAHLRVRELFLPKRFTDELTLMKEHGSWRIVAKVWDFEILREGA